MSLVDAIARAKQMGKQRRLEDRRNAEAESRSVSPRARSTKAAAAEATGTHLVLEPAEFERLHYDVGACANNHIIVPDVETHLGQPASPPYRMLRTRILQRCRASDWSTIAITSPGAGEGKSVTALNLAISIAREGNNDVFLLDLDMRNPSICKYLGVWPTGDIVKYFSGQEDVRKLFFSIGIDKLTIGGGLARAANASELLATGRFKEILEFVRRVSANPLVIVDLPPVASTDDALVVAPLVDAFVLVVSEGRTRRDGLQSALTLLADYPMAGVVLNQTHESLGVEYYGAYA